MTIIFTLCSNNYLANAITLNQSVRDIHPDIKFVIGIVDKCSDDLKSFLIDFDTLYIDNLDSAEVDEMKCRYNIIELNTAVKPYYIEYFFEHFNAQKVIYLDPDTFLFEPIDLVINQLDNFSYLLTPHSLSPINDSYLLTEQVTLSTGTFNLGFFAIKNDIIGNRLIDWWKQKLYKECILDTSRGYFVDQKWMNLSICYFDGFDILKHPGVNMAHWNLHERVLSTAIKGKYIVNETFPLILFHFSSFKPDKPESIANWQNRYSFETRPDIRQLFDDYSRTVLSNNYYLFTKVVPAYGVPFENKISFKRKIKNKFKTYFNL